MMKSATTTTVASAAASSLKKKDDQPEGESTMCPCVVYYQNKIDAKKEVSEGKRLFELCYINKNSLNRVAFGQCSYKRGKDGGGCHHHREDTKKTSLITLKELERALETGETIKAKINYEIRDCTVTRITSGSHDYFITMGTRGRKRDETKMLTHTFDDMENPIYRILTNANDSSASLSKKENLMLKCFAEIIQTQPQLAKRLLASSKEAVLKKIQGSPSGEVDADDADEAEADADEGGEPTPENVSEVDADDLAAMMATEDDAASHGTKPAILPDPDGSSEADEADEAEDDNLSEVTMEEVEAAAADEEAVQAEEIEDDEGNTFAVDPSTMIVYLEDGTEIGVLTKMPRAKYGKIEYNEISHIIAVPRDIKGKEYYICYHTQNAFDPSMEMKHVGVAKEDKEGNLKLVKSSTSTVADGKKK